MNAIIWWLESPWQLRALVFILSFFICFVGPWLHSQSLLTTQLLAKKLHDQYSATVLAPKVEGLLQTLPPSEEQAPAEGKAVLQPPPAAAEGKEPPQHQDAPRPAEAPQSADQGQVKEPAGPEAAPAQEAAQLQEGGPALRQVPAGTTPVPVPALEERTREQAQAAPSPDINAPVPQDHAPVEEAPVPVEPSAPAKQEQAEIQPPAAVAPASEFNILDRGMRAVVAVPAGRPASRQDLAVSTEGGGSADVEVYVLSQGRDLRHFAIFDSDAFAKAAARYDAVVCAGPGHTRLADDGAVELCHVLARKPYISTTTKLYGLPLSEKEAAPRSLAIIGIKNVRGNLADPAIQMKMIPDIIRSGKIANFSAVNPAGTGPEKEPDFIEVKRGTGSHETRPVRTSTAKRAYAHQSKGHEGNFPVVHAVHKRSKANESIRHLAKRDKRIRHSHAVAETKANKTHRCGLFDFPF